MTIQEQLLDIFRNRDCPYVGLTAAQVHQKRVWRSWCGRKFGPNSFVASIFGASVSRTLIALNNFETAGILKSEWDREDGPFPRRRVYFLNPDRGRS